MIPFIKYVCESLSLLANELVELLSSMSPYITHKEIARHFSYNFDDEVNGSAEKSEKKERSHNTQSSH